AEAAAEFDMAPGLLTRRFGVDVASVFRRLASMPEDRCPVKVGLVACDGSGTLTFRKQVAGFALPRFGAACPLWPLYQALSRPMAPIRAEVQLPGRPPQRFLSYAICESSQPLDFDAPQVLEAWMLILPAPAEGTGLSPQPVGTSCRICPRRDCRARREPSILADGF
ncbi:MAG: short-chain fatty acyl-CoA regulator family protein, partial [Paracoccaceae bacterium]